MADLAAAYAFGIARNHPFIDGDKRTEWAVARLFRGLNRVSFRFSPADAIGVVEDLAGGSQAFRRRGEVERRGALSPSQTSSVLAPICVAASASLLSWMPSTGVSR